MCLVTCFAHPDDAELWAGGAICLHSVSGVVGRIICFDTGEPERIREAEAAANTLGVERLTILPRMEKWWQGTESNLEDVIRLFRQDPPDVVVTHPLDDTHPEHVAAARLAIKAAIRVQDLTGQPIEVYESSTYLGRTTNGLFTPSTLIDVSAVWDRKVSALRCYRSQDPETLLSFIDAQTRFYGSLCGVNRAEGFRLYPLLGQGWHAENLFWPFASKRAAPTAAREDQGGSAR